VDLFGNKSHIAWIAKQIVKEKMWTEKEWKEIAGESKVQNQGKPTKSIQWMDVFSQNW